MKNNWLATLLIPLALLLPNSGFAVTLDPGTVGNFFTFTTVESLDSNAFTIDFSEGKFLTITPYEADARFVFGIDFNSTGLEAASIAGYLTDSLGNEIAGTSFTGVAISAGFGGGIVELNQVVVAYGAHITFTGDAPGEFQAYKEEYKISGDLGALQTAVAAMQAKLERRQEK